jgi:hypothetical protein
MTTNRDTVRLAAAYQAVFFGRVYVRGGEIRIAENPKYHMHVSHVELILLVVLISNLESSIMYYIAYTSCIHDKLEIVISQ